MGLKLMVFDRTCRGRGPSLGLSHAWSAGMRLYRGLGYIDDAIGVTTWSDGLEWLVGQPGAETIDEIQFWGHGKWGDARVDGEALSAFSLVPGHVHHQSLEALRERLSPGALFWFRTCETLGARAGHDFAERFGDFLGCSVAGHTYVIHALQSGLHLREPGVRPHWTDEEGLLAGSALKPSRSLNSVPGAPNTIHCLQHRVPPGW